MLKRNCNLCGNVLFVKPSHFNMGGGKYCSRECKYRGSRKGRDVKCFICGKRSYKTKLGLIRSKSKKFFCSRSCQTKWRNSHFSGPKHANWKDGSSTYRDILDKSDRLKACMLCKIDDIRVLATHHIDENKKNNNIDNLAWLCHNCHHLVHHYNDEKSKFMALIV